MTTNRPIKFRAWDKTSKQMFYPNEWFFGDIAKAKHPSGKTLEVVPLQFTGLKDKNGVEIYEGDILKTTARLADPIGIVEWNDKVVGFRLSGSGYSVGVLKPYEVIGNIYSTPELLS